MDNGIPALPKSLFEQFMVLLISHVTQKRAVVFLSVILYFVLASSFFVTKTLMHNGMVSSLLLQQRDILRDFFTSERYLWFDPVPSSYPGHPDNEVYMRLSTINEHFFNEDYDRVLGELQEIQQDSTYDKYLPNIYHGMGMTNQIQGNTAEAIKFFTRACELAKASPNYKSCLGSLLNAYASIGDEKNTFSLLKEIKKMSAGEADNFAKGSNHYTLGKLLFLYFRYDQAIDSFNKAIENYRKEPRWQDSDESELHFWLAETHIAKWHANKPYDIFDFKKAIEEYNLAIKMWPGNTKARLGLQYAQEGKQGYMPYYYHVKLNRNQ